MNSLSKFAIALVPILLYSSFATASDDLGIKDGHVEGVHKTSSEKGLSRVDYFDANWALFTRDDRNGPEVDAATETAYKYLDANWSLFENKEE